MKKHNPTVAPEEITQLMKKVRLEKGLSQVIVARQLGISQPSLSKMENGMGEPTASQWFEFCKMTAIPVNYFTRGQAKAVKTGSKHL